MKKERIIKIFILLLCLVANIAHAADKLEQKFFTRDGVYHLGAFDQTAGDDNYFGVYSSPFAHTGGTELHLFPNGRFVIVLFMDIAPEEVLARGSYKVVETSLLLDFSLSKPISEKLRKKFTGLRIVHGYRDKAQYPADSAAFVFFSESWEKLSARDLDVQFMKRMQEYRDWERILRRYEEAK